MESRVRVAAVPLRKPDWLRSIRGKREGQGFVVGNYIYTAWHVVADDGDTSPVKGEVLVGLSTWKEVEWTRIGDLDAATTPKIGSGRSTKFAKPVDNESVSVYSTIKDGSVSTDTIIVSAGGTEINHACETQEGDSGAPLINGQERVVGMHVAGGAANLAIPSTVLLENLNRTQAAPRGGRSV
jgi:hypothetical protein